MTTFILVNSVCWCKTNCDNVPSVSLSLTGVVSDRALPARSVQEDGSALLHSEEQGPTWTPCPQEDAYLLRAHLGQLVSVPVFYVFCAFMVCLLHGIVNDDSINA